jgi:hypothetical protein
MSQTFWKASWGLFLVGGILFLSSAGVLAVTKHSLDFSIHDRYLLAQPRSLLLVAALLFVATLVVWKVKLSR